MFHPQVICDFPKPSWPLDRIATPGPFFHCRAQSITNSCFDLAYHIITFPIDVFDTGSESPLNIKSPVFSSQPWRNQGLQKSADTRRAMTGNGQAWLMAGRERQDRRGCPHRPLALVGDSLVALFGTFRVSNVSRYGCFITVYFLPWAHDILWCSSMVVPGIIYADPKSTLIRSQFEALARNLFFQSDWNSSFCTSYVHFGCHWPNWSCEMTSQVWSFVANCVVLLPTELTKHREHIQVAPGKCGPQVFPLGLELGKLQFTINASYNWRASLGLGELG